MSRIVERNREREIWISWVRLLAVPWAFLEVGFVAHDYPARYHLYAWLTAVALAIGAALLAWLARKRYDARGQLHLSLGALTFDAVIVYSFFAIYSFEEGIPARGLVYLLATEAAVRFGILGGVLLPIVTLPLLVLVEWFRADRFGMTDFDLRHITIPLGIELVTGLVVGGLVRQLGQETARAEARAVEAEGLRDQIGRHADQLEVVNRCARALSSSLELEEAFRLFVREIRTAIRFDRLALVLARHDRAEIVANAGVGEHTVYPAHTSQPIEGSVVEDLIVGGRAISIEDMLQDPQYPEDRTLAEVGLRSRLAAPLVTGGRTLGMLSLSRREPHAFDEEEADFLTLLGRQLATAVENIRAFEAERTAAEELRRLSALRADFVSLVSHELRGPMASVIGGAATLRQRWRTLTPEQRESFLGLIEEETARLAALVGDVLDTSRLEAGTFTYSFADVDVGEVVREVAAAVDVAQEEVSIRAEVTPSLPVVRADRERLRQVLMNLLTNAVKYTIAGDEVRVLADAADGGVSVSVVDNGPGISPEDQRLIFEKFGRASTAGGPQPGAGLGLFIARSITEAHGGSLEVDSAHGRGARFTVRLPVSESR